VDTAAGNHEKLPETIQFFGFIGRPWIFQLNDAVCMETGGMGVQFFLNDLLKLVYSAGTN
jgi:hypothetical protein